ncbi:M14 family zinc carboxypeptidase [Variovorax sp. J22G73]|uniref:M14 family zinc carboxypeptidase n=1 Tax=unclassified Variovorax TaxID=663243 RepID=UPI000D5C3395|nr:MULTISPECIES: M14 family zinc carboxypeptidase [unclassified Variovorax]MDM0007705.1 M14 family zinc carboxypeptidase [Variovorax sp. J22R203]MDM0099935.1 M14 family zinc carboxypeptidase [Variovorax sp. J22G73]
MTATPHPLYPTPFESGNGNQTATWAECIAFYEQLAQRFPGVLQWRRIGVSDTGVPMHAGVVTADGVFEREALQRQRRPVFFNNNGIHPGEPEGIDACMALVRDFCTQPERLAALGDTVFLFIPVYNVDGCLNRQNTSRVNQLGPESFGFRGNGLHLDLNRDFIKCDSLAAQVFNRFFTTWDPDVMVDTHTSNGADYACTMTLIPTQPDKLGGTLGDFLRERMLPAIYGDMDRRGWPTCPYVNLLGETPDEGIEDFLDLPRFSTGYAALHHTIGFMPETHMLKPYADRVAAMRTLVEVVLGFTVAHAARIQGLRRDARAAAARQARWPLAWRNDHSRPATLRFKGYEAVRMPSQLGSYQRLAYDRNQPWEKDIVHFDRCVEEAAVAAPRAYLVPQAWREVIERLEWNGVLLRRLEADELFDAARVYRVQEAVPRPNAYEGHMFHDRVVLATHTEAFQARAGDVWVPLDQPAARYAVETLEPEAHDSFFRWGFFNSVLEKKEAFSAYVFEDTALRMLQDEPALKHAFKQWKVAHPELLSDPQAVLGFLFAHGQRHAERGWRRYPVVALM